MPVSGPAADERLVVDDPPQRSDSGPLPRHPLAGFVSTSARTDEGVNRLFRILFPAATAVPLRGTAPVFAYRLAPLGLINLSVLGGQGFTVHADTALNVIYAATPSGHPGRRISIHGRDLPFGGRNAGVFSPGSAKVPFAAGLDTVAARVPPRLLVDRIEAFTGRTFHEIPRFEPQVDLDSEAPAAFHRTLCAVLTELDRSPRLVERPIITAGWQDLLVGSMLGLLPHSASALLERPQPAIAPWQVRRAEDWLAAHACEPLRMEDLATAVGASLRTIQHAFKRWRGISPRAFLERCRLDLARRRLLAAGPGDTVTEIALACGFSHLSDFARIYRQRFGESPSVTLNRSR